MPRRESIQSPCAATFNRRTAEAVRRRYVVDGLSIRRTADELGLPRKVVSAVLRDLGVAVAPRGAGRARPRRAPAPPLAVAEALVELYVTRRLSRAEVARRLGVPESRIRTWLRHLGVPTRTRGRSNREDRRRDPPQAVEDLYVTAELTADEVASHLGSTRGRVLASAHEGGIPVRPGAAAAEDQPVPLLTALYSDSRVRAALQRHGIPIVPTPGPITQRFPVAAKLTLPLLADLYESCGLSTVQIELVTGQPAATVRRHLQDSHFPLRSAGGVAPFTRRARRAVRGTPTAAPRRTRAGADAERESPPGRQGARRAPAD
jgi:transposase-like protein